MELSIARIVEIPLDIQDLIDQSKTEGFRMIARMRDEWISGKNRFDKVGEALWVVRNGSELAGICGLNQDPYSDETSIGRIRRMYVSPEFRRAGVGRMLVETVLDHADGNFDFVQLRSTPAADKFYTAVGFQKVDEVPEVTRRLRIW